jgi:hypothetical protein
MELWIQASNPRGTAAHDPADETLDEAIETAFPLNTECAFLVWHHIPVALSYKHDIAVMMGDLCALLPAILCEPAGQRTVAWPSSTFRADWTVTWREDELIIEARWVCVTGGLEQALNASGAVSMSKVQFTREWKEVLGQVLNALEQRGSGNAPVDGEAELARLFDLIPGSGLLYG